MSKDWIGMLNGTTDDKFTQFCDTVNDAVDSVAPKKQ